MTILKFIKQCSTLDEPIGDLARDIKRDKNFPKGKSEKEIIEYLNSKTDEKGLNEIFEEFITEFNALKKIK